MKHPDWRIAREAGVRVSTVRLFLSGRLISGFAERRIKAALRTLGMAAS